MQIKNLLFQPISLNLSLDGCGLHLNAREAVEVLDHQVSDEIKLAAARGLVSLIGSTADAIDHALGSEPTPAGTTADIEVTVSTDSPKKGARR